MEGLSERQNCGDLRDGRHQRSERLMKTEDQTEGQPQVATSAVVCAERAWTPSHREEVISALWFIVAFVALDAGCPGWVFLTFFVKACMDSICAIRCAVREWRREDSHTT